MALALSLIGGVGDQSPATVTVEATANDGIHSGPEITTDLAFSVNAAIYHQSEGNPHATVVFDGFTADMNPTFAE